MPTRPLLALVAVLLLLGGATVFYFAGQEPGPLVRIEKPAAIGGGSIDLDLIVDAIGGGLTRLDVAVEQAGRTLPLFSLASSGAAKFTQETPDRMRVTQTTAAGSLTGLRDGPARVVVTASRGVLFGLRQAESVTTRDVAVRMTPPSLAVVSTHHYVNLGGAEMVVYRVTPADTSSGVQVGDRFYAGFPAAGDRLTHAALADRRAILRPSSGDRDDARTHRLVRPVCTADHRLRMVGHQLPAR